MQDWEDLRHFLALAQSGTLSAAARALGVEHATVSRRIAHLEQAFGAKLVDRRGRRILLTATGHAVAAIAERMSTEALKIGWAALQADYRLAGEVRVSAPPALASAILVEPIVRLRQSHPGIAITLIGETRYASLGRREADVAVRLTRPEQGDLTVQKIGVVNFGLYAAPAYVEATPAEAWSFVGYDEAMETSPQERRLREIAGDRPIAVRASTLEFQLATVKGGGGVGLLPDFMVADDTLARLPMPGGPLQREIWLAVHTDIKDVPLIRAVLDAFAGG